MNDAILESIATHVRDNTTLDVDGSPAEGWSLEGLDSVEMLELIQHLESTFGITVDERQLTLVETVTEGAPGASQRRLDGSLSHW